MNDLQKKIAHVMEIYGSIPEGHFTDESLQNIISLVDELDDKVSKIEELVYEENTDMKNTGDTNDAT